MSDRSTKRQKELLQFVDGFIKEHGYGPSYREVMSGLGYKSVSTVAVHVDGLISKGYLRKTDNSARSLEVVTSEYVPGSAAGAVKTAASKGDAAKERWLVDAINVRFEKYEGGDKSQQLLDELYVLIGALKVVGFDAAYEAMRAKLARAVMR